MKLFTVFMSVLFIVSTSCAVTEYQWPGPLVIPSDGTKAIESGSIRVQLPDNFTFVSRHVKVREGVEVTLDCSPIIKKFESSPLLVRGHSQVTWSVKYYNSYSKTFGYKKIENDSYGFIISGDKDSQLKIKEVSFLTPAKLSVTENSSYVCESCYDELSPISGAIMRTLCHNSTTHVQAIGYAPTINRNGELPDMTLRIGQTVYMNDYGSTDVLRVVCEQNGTTIKPRPYATILFNGEPIVPSLPFALLGHGLSSYGAHVYVIPSILASRNLSGNLTCILSNQFGSDTETTEIIFDASTIWKTGAWSECTQQCGGGRRQRNLTCVDSKTNEELSSSECNAFKPSENEPCNLQDCCFDVISLCSTVKSLCSYNKIKYMCCKTCSA